MRVTQFCSCIVLFPTDSNPRARTAAAKQHSILTWLLGLLSRTGRWIGVCLYVRQLINRLYYRLSERVCSLPPNTPVYLQSRTKPGGRWVVLTHRKGNRGGWRWRGDHLISSVCVCGLPWGVLRRGLKNDGLVWSGHHLIVWRGCWSEQ